MAPWPAALLVVVVGSPATSGSLGTPSTPATTGHPHPDRWPAVAEVLVVEEWIPRLGLDVDGRLCDRASDAPFDLALGRSVADALPGPVQEVRRATPAAVIDRVLGAGEAVAVAVPAVRGVRARWRRRRLRRRVVRAGAIDLS